MYFMLAGTFAFAQTGPKVYNYFYDPSGNRIGITLGTAILKSGVIDSVKQKITDEIAGFEIKLYPNPVQEELIIEMNPDIFTEFSSEPELILYNIKGQTVVKKQTSEAKTTIDVAHLPTGIYILRLKQDSDFREWKIIKN